ncbi:GntR family transcriptional regulator [Vineibacter terrae]|uniref:GntR family transcriptional regulator n=1 Tax=Vineibacter terrae TaxID=2586908 RepID=UPI002E371AA1|nr:GntR family transcriptional regulator [Vineibacter terrae]HEX2887212.1 GntR family transcriptional regulator [Vineibacter terrae]
MSAPQAKQLARKIHAVELPSVKTLIEKVYGELKRDIVRGYLRPRAKLRVEALRARYQVSSSTIREALLLLVADALVTSEGQRGFRVAPVSLDDLREITTLRKMMETMALRESIALGDDNWESGVVAAFHKLSLIDTRRMRKSEEVAREWDKRNHAFHEALIAAAKSSWVRHFRHILYHSSERYRALSVAILNVRPGVGQEHKAIMDAALARDADLACRLTEEHIERNFAMFSRIPKDVLDPG